MFEELLDDVAQNSTFRHVHPGTKVLLGLGSLVICLVSPTPIVPLISGVLLSLVLLIPARVSPLVYGELLVAPAIFTIISVVVLLFLLGGVDVIWRFNPAPWINLTITTGSIRQSTLVFCRVFGCSVSLFFIVLTTPMTDLFNGMKRIGIPIELIDGMLFISSWNAGEDLIRAMDCRCYDGIFPSLDITEPVRMRSLIPVLLYLAGLTGILLAMTTGGLK